MVEIATARLTKEELLERLRLGSAPLVDEIYALATRQLQSEELREARLENKAQTLLTASGLSLTVAITLGGMLLAHPNRFATSWSVIFTVAYVLAIATGIAASLQAVRAMYVSDEYKGVAERDVFNPTLLEASDPRVTGDDAPAADRKGLSEYRRCLIVHFWQIWQTHFRIHENKAKTIQRGQSLFLLFLLMMMVLGIGVATSHDSRQTADPSEVLHDK